MVQKSVFIFFTKSTRPCGLGAALRNGRRVGKVDFVVVLVKCGLSQRDGDLQVWRRLRFRKKSTHLWCPTEMLIMSQNLDCWFTLLFAQFAFVNSKLTFSFLKCPMGDVENGNWVRTAGSTSGKKWIPASRHIQKEIKDVFKKFRYIVKKLWESIRQP